jgi:hypothetical protein
MYFRGFVIARKFCVTRNKKQYWPAQMGVFVIRGTVHRNAHE